METLKIVFWTIFLNLMWLQAEARVEQKASSKNQDRCLCVRPKKLCKQKQGHMANWNTSSDIYQWSSYWNFFAGEDDDLGKDDMRLSVCLGCQLRYNPTEIVSKLFGQWWWFSWRLFMRLASWQSHASCQGRHTGCRAMTKSGALPYTGNTRPEFSSGSIVILGGNI